MDRDSARRNPEGHEIEYGAVGNQRSCELRRRNSRHCACHDRFEDPEAAGDIAEDANGFRNREQDDKRQQIHAQQVT
jgi:hypothetical protein